MAVVVIGRFAPPPADVARLPEFEPDYPAFKSSWDIILIFAVIFFGTICGVLVPTEAAALALVMALLFIALRRRLNKKTYTAACKIALIGTGWLFMLMLGAMIFGYFLTVTRLPYELAEALAWSWNRYVVLALIFFVIVLLGCCIEAMPLMLLAVPVLYPLAVRLGFHPIWFGILALRCIGLGLMLPFGGINKITGVDARMAARGVMPFVIADLVLILAMIAVPRIVLWPL